MSRTDFLFATPSFIGGMASVLDIGATLVQYNQSLTTAEADTKAMQSDWETTGKDLRAAMNKWSEAHHGKE